MYKEKAAQHLLEGNRKAAQECFERCVDVTPEMARTVMKVALEIVLTNLDSARSRCRLYHSTI